MKFTPLSTEELAKQRGQLIPGNAEFSIVAAEDCVSKQQNPMIKLQLRVWDSAGHEGTIFDYLVASAQWKIKNLLESIGKAELYEQGKIDPSQLVGQSGSAVIYIQKDPSGEFGDRPKIKDYFLREPMRKVASGRRAASMSDNVPF